MERSGRRRLEFATRELEDERAARRALDREVRLLRAALTASPVGMVVLDRDGQAIVRTVVRRPGDHSDVLIDDAVERVAAAALNGERQDRRLELLGPPPRTLRLLGTPLAGGALVVVEDLSERTRVDAVRTDFVANISHELKTPIGALAVLAETLADLDDVPTMRTLAERVVMEAHRAAGTIDDLLELSRIELGGPSERERVDLNASIAEAVRRTSLAAERQGIELVVAEGSPAAALGDSRQIVSALANLLDNAVKYSDDGGAVIVAVTRNGNWLNVSVADHGIGIPARDLDRIFERFYRVDRARSRETGGTGLGLAIVRHVANNHQGEVRVQSHEGEGSTFTLSLPAAPEEGTGT